MSKLLQKVILKKKFLLPGEAQSYKEEGLRSWFLMVVVKVNVYAAKLEIVEAKYD